MEAAYQRLLPKRRAFYYENEKIISSSNNSCTACINDSPSTSVDNAEKGIKLQAIGLMAGGSVILTDEG